MVDGELTLGSTIGLTFSAGSNGSSSMTVTGMLANLNAALSGLVYTPNAGYFGPDSLQMSVNDTGDSLTGSATVSLTVNPPPVVTAPATASVTENTSLMFSGTISLADAVASGTSDSLTLSVTHGTLDALDHDRIDLFCRQQRHGIFHRDRNSGQPNTRP